MVAYDGQSPSSAVKKSTANDLGADLDLSQLLEPSDLSPSDSGVRPRDAYGQAVLSRSDASLHLQRDAETDADGTPWHMMTRPLKVEGRKHRICARRGRRGTGRATAKSGAIRRRFRRGLDAPSAAAPASNRATFRPRPAAPRCSSPANCCAKPFWV